MITPFENLIQDLGREMEVVLHVDPKQSCLLFFSEVDLSIQIDLDGDADQILIGTELGPLHPGSFRKLILIEAMRANGTAPFPRGVLAYSEKQASLVLFQFLLLEALTGKRLYHFLEGFKEHASLWKEALKRGVVPTLNQEAPPPPENPFGLNR